MINILKVLRTLMLSPIGLYLTNSSVCEIMQSCFQIFFENRLTELLRRTAESILVDMVQLLFARLPQFKEEIRYSAVKKLTMKGDNTRQKKSKRSKDNPTIMPKNSSTDLSHTVLKLHNQAKNDEGKSNEKLTKEEINDKSEVKQKELTEESEKNNFYLSEPNIQQEKEKNISLDENPENINENILNADTESESVEDFKNEKNTINTMLTSESNIESDSTSSQIVNTEINNKTVENFLL